MGARREVLSAVADRYRSAGRREKGRILDELAAVTGWHRKHAVRALSAKPPAVRGETVAAQATIRRRDPGRADGAVGSFRSGLRQAARGDDPDACCRHWSGTAGCSSCERAHAGAVGERCDHRPAAGRCEGRGSGRPAPRVGFLLRDPPRGADPHVQRLERSAARLLRDRHGGARRHTVAGSFIQTLTMVDVATGWTECLPLGARDGSLVVEAIKRAQSLFPWLMRGADFDNDSAFMNDVVVPWCRAQKIEVTRSRAYKKNDQAFVEQKNGAVVRRLVGYGRFDGIETAQVMARLYAAARLHVNFFQPSFKLKEKRREGAKVIKRYHAPATPYERALAHPKLSKAIKRRLREHLSHSRSGGAARRDPPCQDELGERIARRGLAAAANAGPADPLAFARALATNASTGEVRATHRRVKRKYKTRMRMPSKLDPHLATIEDWLAAEPQITALAILRRLHCDRSGYLRRQATFDRATAAQGAQAQGGAASDRRDHSRRGPGKNAQRGCWRPCGRATPSLRPANTRATPTSPSAIAPGCLR